MDKFIELTNDQRREMINTRQRFHAFRQAEARAHSYRGSMVWEITKGHEYLIRAYYEDGSVRRRQKSLGRRTAETELIKKTFDVERIEAGEDKKSRKALLVQQAAINRVLGLGRVPQMAAKILRNVEAAGLLGSGLRVVGTNALYAYEAACGVFLDPGMTTTEDIDLLFDARRHLRLIGKKPERGAVFLDLLQSADPSFKRLNTTFRAQNRDGYLVDVIKPLRNAPWKPERGLSSNENDLEAVGIEGLIWLENAPGFEQLVLDERGSPLRMVAVDPRIFAVHKHWLSKRIDRDPLQKGRDLAQARAVFALVQNHLQHLPLSAGELKMIPKAIVEQAMIDLSAV
jgi:hypothetical protein